MAAEAVLERLCGATSSIATVVISGIVSFLTCYRCPLGVLFMCIEMRNDTKSVALCSGLGVA